MVAAPDIALDLVSTQGQRGPQNSPEVALGGVSEALQLCLLAATGSCYASLPAQLQHHMTQAMILHADNSDKSSTCAAMQLSISCCFAALAGWTLIETDLTDKGKMK